MSMRYDKTKFREIKERKLRYRKTNRHPAKENEKEESRRSIAIWWRNRVISGHLLDGDFQEGLDYFGSLPWPARVTLRALHRQYVRDTGGEVTRLEFIHRLRSAMKMPVGDYDLVLEKNRFGRIVEVRFVTSYDVDCFKQEFPEDDLTRVARYG